jgi:hypothetical protein
MIVVPDGNNKDVDGNFVKILKCIMGNIKKNGYVVVKEWDWPPPNKVISNR